MNRFASTRSENLASQPAAGRAQWSVGSIDDDGITLGNSRNVNAVGGVYDALFFLPPVDAGVVCGHPTATDPCVEVEDP